LNSTVRTSLSNKKLNPKLNPKEGVLKIQQILADCEALGKSKEALIWRKVLNCLLNPKDEKKN